MCPAGSFIDQVSGEIMVLHLNSGSFSLVDHVPGARAES